MKLFCCLLLEYLTRFFPQIKCMCLCQNSQGDVKLWFGFCLFVFFFNSQYLPYTPCLKIFISYFLKDGKKITKGNWWTLWSSQFLQQLTVPFFTQSSSVWVLCGSSFHHKYVIVSSENSSITHLLMLRQCVSEMTETNASVKNKLESFICSTIPKPCEGWLRFGELALLCAVHVWVSDSDIQGSGWAASPRGASSAA